MTLRLSISAVLFLAPLVAAGPPRAAHEILRDHFEALGKASTVRTLRARGRVSQGGHEFPEVESLFQLDGRAARSMRPSPEAVPQQEFFGPAGAFVKNAGAYWRFRPGQETGRAIYYLQKALAEPFPLLVHREGAAGGAGLEVASAEGHEVLVGRRDEHGVRAVYLLDGKTHLLANIRFEREQGRPFVNVAFKQHRRVGPVVLHHGVWARFGLLSENKTKKTVTSATVTRSEVILEWEVNAPVAAGRLDPPGLGTGGAKGFERRSLRTGPDPHEAAAADLDGDGRTDLAVACWGGIAVHFGGDADVEPHRFVALGRGQHRGLVIEDLDRDGHPEVITASNVEPAEMLFLVTFDGRREHRKRTIFGAPHFAHRLACEDLDRDGLGDLVACGWRTVNFSFGNGVGGLRLASNSWPLFTEENPNRHGFGFDVGRLDADDLPDVALADGERIVVFQGHVNLSFHPRVSMRAGPRPVDVVFADLDADGRQDLVVANEHPMADLKRDLAVLMNTGKGLKGRGLVAAGERTPALVAGHFDADGHVDVATASFLSGEVVLLFGDGRGGLGHEERLASGRGTHRLSVVDFDGDRRQDLLATNRLADTVTLFLNRRAEPVAEPPATTRAVVCPGLTGIEFRLEGLSDPYEFVAEFELPESIHDPSGIAFLGGDPVHTQLVFVPDKRSVLHRAVIDRARRRLLVGPEVPLVGAPEGRLDLEALDFDRESGNLFLGCEADSSILRANLFGHVLARAESEIPVGMNDGIEALAVRRLKDGTPLLYVFKERMGVSGRQPPVHVYGMEEDPFRLVLRSTVHLPLPLPDQTGATILEDRMIVVGRLMRSLLEMSFQGEGFRGKARIASFRALSDKLLGLVDEDHPLYGTVEGVTADHNGDLYLIVDNNRKAIGRKGLNRGAGGRLLWLRNVGPGRDASRPIQVTFRFLLFPGKEGGDAARECLQRLRTGEDFAVLEGAHEAGPAGTVRAIERVRSPEPGEVRRSSLPPALARLVFALKVGESGLCRFHAEESPAGWYVVERVE